MDASALSQSLEKELSSRLGEGRAREILACLRGIAAAPESLVSGYDLALALGADRDALDDLTAQLENLVREWSRDMAAQIDHGWEESRIRALREALSAAGLAAVVIPMADEYQNEYVPRYAQRLAWISGFLGSAGTVIVGQDTAAVFVDGRYILQAREQID
ncbi:MAG: aminopeptidase P family N-terminal domain-containing protein, partial [Alphaproteobacteria bacterium]|nr:aminopeptidase P family N-terminal domain-containing protein [Alphaproteobacteria bacterium]